ncbi:MAG: hypothetical protein QX192_09615 [Methylococcales bacterium]
MGSGDMTLLAFTVRKTVLVSAQGRFFVGRLGGWYDVDKTIYVF